MTGKSCHHRDLAVSRHLALRYPANDRVYFVVIFAARHSFSLTDQV
jgi:hypothetical protein